MRRIATIFIVAIFLASAAPVFAADTKDAGEPKKTVFNKASEFFSKFDKSFARPGNKQGFWQATADWMRNINNQ